MKNVFKYACSIALALSSVACFNNGSELTSKEAAELDSFRRAEAEKTQTIEKFRQDSIAQVQKQKKKTLEDSIRKAEMHKNFVTPDLTFFELRGQVKSVSYNYYEAKLGFKKSASFTANGTVVTPNGVKLKRSNGKIKEVEYYEDLIGQWLGDSFITNDNGQIISSDYTGPDGSGTEKFYYDDNGRLSKTTTSGHINGEPFHNTSTFSYKSFDQYGNWTKRIEKSSYGNSTQTRKITYY